MSYIDDLAARIRSVARVAGPWSWGDRLWGWQVDTCSAVDIGVVLGRRSHRHVPTDGLHLSNRQLVLMGCGAAKAPAYERRSSVVK